MSEDGEKQWNSKYILKVARTGFVDGLEVGREIKRSHRGCHGRGLSKQNGIVFDEMRKHLGANVNNSVWDVFSLCMIHMDCFVTTHPWSFWAVCTLLSVVY